MSRSRTAAGNEISGSAVPPYTSVHGVARAASDRSLDCHKLGSLAAEVSGRRAAE